MRGSIQEKLGKKLLGFQNVRKLETLITRETQVQSLSTWKSLESLFNILLKRSWVKMPFIFTVFKIFLLEGRLVLRLTKWASGSESIKFYWKKNKKCLIFVGITSKLIVILNYEVLNGFYLYLTFFKPFRSRKTR